MDVKLAMVVHVLALVKMAELVVAQDVVGCGGFVQSDVEINYSLIEVRLYSYCYYIYDLSVVFHSEFWAWTNAIFTVIH